MQNKKALLILNGELKNSFDLENLIKSKNYDYIICCDGGFNHLYKDEKLIVEPHYIVGDLDSVDKDLLDKFDDIEIKRFKSEKDETDTELAILLCESLKCKEIDLVGALGNRIDHTISNINILYYIRKLNIYPRILSGSETIYLIKDENVSFNIKKYSTVSIIPINGDLKNLTLKGFKYDVCNINIDFSSPIGMSNIIKSDKVFIEIKNGSLLFIVNN